MCLREVFRGVDADCSGAQLVLEVGVGGLLVEIDEESCENASGAVERPL